MIRFEVTEPTERSYDNPYEHKLNIWYGPEEMPYHEAVALTAAELIELKENMLKLCDHIKNIGE